MKKYLILFILLLTGCTNYTELNNLSVVKNIGLSYQDNSYVLHTEIIQEVKDNNPITKIITTTDQKIDNLFRKIQIESTKELSFTHLDLMIVDKTINNRQYNELIYYIVNQNTIRSDFYCIYTDNIQILLENAKFNEIEELILTHKNINKLTFLDLARRYLTTKKFTISYITINQSLLFKTNLLFTNDNYERIKNEKE